MSIADSRKTSTGNYKLYYYIYNIQMRHFYILNITKNYQIYKKSDSFLKISFTDRRLLSAISIFLKIHKSVC